MNSHPQHGCRWSVTSIRRLATAALAALCTGVVEARADFPAVLAQAEAESNGPSFVLDTLLFAALVGAALFAICRAGRRN